MTSCTIPNIELSISILSSDSFWPAFSYGGPEFVYASCDSGLKGSNMCKWHFWERFYFPSLAWATEWSVHGILHYYSDQKIRAEVEVEQHSGTKNVYAGAQGWFRIYRLMESLAAIIFIFGSSNYEKFS